MTDIKNTIRVDLQDVITQVERRVADVCRNAELDVDRYAVAVNEYPIISDFMNEGAAIIADRCSFVKHFTQTGIDAITHYPEFEDECPEPDYTFTDAITLTDLYNAQVITSAGTDKDGNTIASATLATLDVVKLEGQSTETENAYYRIGADYASIIKYPTPESDEFVDPDGVARDDDDLQARSHKKGIKLVHKDQGSVSFNITNMADALKYTVSQQHIKSAMIYFILFKWWMLKMMPDIAMVEERQFETSVNNAANSSVLNHNRRKIAVTKRWYS